MEIWISRRIQEEQKESLKQRSLELLEDIEGTARLGLFPEEVLADRGCWC